MYLQGYESSNGQLGFLKKLKKAVDKTRAKVLKPIVGQKKAEKIVRQMGKVRDKVGGAVAAGAALYFTGGAAAPLVAKALQRSKEKKQIARDQAELERLMQASTAPAAAPVEPVTTMAPTADSVRAAVMSPTNRRGNTRVPRPANPGSSATAAPSLLPQEAPGPIFDEQISPPSAEKPSTPAWLIPAGIAAGGIVLVLALAPRRSSR